MYQPNTHHQQYDVFGVEIYFPKKKLEKLMTSMEYTFYRPIFCNIDEDLFSVLYSDEKSHPNAPVNAMVSALILMQQKGWQLQDQRSATNCAFHLPRRMHPVYSASAKPGYSVNPGKVRLYKSKGA